ncbi:MAG: hypothetical protein M3463_20220 [Verrucomicrobiota bacterium]|nr:hypothetical protein [Verrucomicrobiota bacterium]
MRLSDDSQEAAGGYRVKWKAEADTEVVVEATVRVGETTGAISKPGSRSIWPWRDGAPVSVLVSDGKHQEGLVFYTDRVSTWTDRFVVIDTASEFHTHRATIRGTDMSIAVNGDVKVRGQGAFWKNAGVVRTVHSVWLELGKGDRSRRVALGATRRAQSRRTAGRRAGQNHDERAVANHAARPKDETDTALRLCHRRRTAADERRRGAGCIVRAVWRHAFHR